MVTTCPPQTEINQEFGELEILTSLGKQSLNHWYWSATVLRHEKQGLHVTQQEYVTHFHLKSNPTGQSLIHAQMCCLCGREAAETGSPFTPRGLITEMRQEFNGVSTWANGLKGHEVKQWNFYTIAYSHSSLAYVTLCCLLTPLETCFSSPGVTKSRIRWGFSFLLY